MNQDDYNAVYAAVGLIPRGCVASYSQVARLAGLPFRARFVGRCLSKLPAHTDVPWHRVVRASGHIAQRDESSEAEQCARLRNEGVRIHGDRVSMREFQWAVERQPGE